MPRSKQCLRQCRLSRTLVTYHQLVAAIPYCEVSRGSCSVSAYEAGKLVWAKQLTRQPCLAAPLKFQFFAGRDFCDTKFASQLKSHRSKSG